MTDFYVRDENTDEEGLFVEECEDAERAAKKACEYWYTRSRWTGSPPPEMELEVRAEGSEEWVRVDVETIWEVRFRGYVP